LQDAATGPITSGAAVAAVIADAEAAKPVGAPKGNQNRARAIKGSDTTIEPEPPKAGRGASYLAARIKRDAPDVAARAEAGEFKSMAAAAREAGVLPPKPVGAPKGNRNRAKAINADSISIEPKPSKPAAGTGAAYLAARIKRDAPDVAARAEEIDAAFRMQSTRLRTFDRGPLAHNACVPYSIVQACDTCERKNQ